MKKYVKLIVVIFAVMMFMHIWDSKLTVHAYSDVEEPDEIYENAEEIFPTGCIVFPDEKPPESVAVFGDDYVPPVGGSEIEIPRKWDYSDFKDYMPPLRNQNPFGTCWAHAVIACAEINLWKKGIVNDPNLSEFQLAYFYYHPVVDPLGGTIGDRVEIVGEKNGYLENGGGLGDAEHVLSSWAGVANDSGELAYPRSWSEVPDKLDDSYAYNYDVAHMVNSYHVDIKGTDEDKEKVKQLIMEKGAIAVSFNSDGINDRKCYNLKYNSYYDSEREEEKPHAVTIVGWDDDFPKEHFSSIPPSDGAWLIRNSWTTGSYENHQSYFGYFWMSYETHSLEGGIAFDYESADNYDHNYQYDGALNNYGGVSSDDSVKGANVFLAQNKEVLRAVSFATRTANVNFKVEIYDDLGDEGLNLSDRPPASVQTGFTSCSGYYTVELSDEVYLDKNDKYAVVVELEKKGYQPVISIESRSNTSWYTSYSDASPGQSYYYNPDTSSWDDVGAKRKANICIKAFTDDAAAPVNVDLSSESTEIIIGDATYTGETVTPPVVVKSEGKALSPSWFDVEYNNNIDAGTGSVTISPREGSTVCVGSRTLSFEIKPASLSDVEFLNRAGSPGRFMHIYPASDINNFNSLWHNGKQLVEGTDYKVLNADDGVFFDVPEEGSYNHIYYCGIGNYTGVRSYEIETSPTDISSQYYTTSPFTNEKYYLGAELSETLRFEYTGSEITVSDLGLVNKTRGALIPGKDYVITGYTDNISVGTATVTVEGCGNYKGTANYKISILPKSIEGASIQLAKTILPYSGNKQEISVQKVVLPNGTELSSDDYTVRGSVSGTSCGVYTVKINGTGDYGGFSATKWCICGNTAPVVGGKPDAEPITYGQALYESKLSGGSVTTEGEFSWKDEYIIPSVSDSDRTEYDVLFVPKDIKNYSVRIYKVKVTVNKAKPSIKRAPSVMKGLYYNGKFQKLLSAGTVDGGDMVYALGENDYDAPCKDWGSEVPSVDNAGTYYVWYKVVGDNDHSDTVPVCRSVGVDPKNLFVIADAQEKAYGNEDPELTYSSTDLIEGDFISGKPEREAGEDVGTYGIGIGSITAGDNYNVIFEGSNLKIDPRSISDATVSLDHESYVFSGEERTVSVKAVTLSGNVVLSPSDYLVTGQATGVDRGVYILTVKGTGNYIGEVKTSWRILAVEPVIEANPHASAIIIGQSLKYSRLVGGVVNVQGVFSWKDDTIVPAVSDSDLTEYEVVFIPTDRNYKEMTCRLTVTVRELKAEIDVDPNDRKLTLIPGEVRRLNVSRTGVYIYGVRYEVEPQDKRNKVISIKNGVVTAKKAGSANVTARYGGDSVTFEITVDGSNPAITVGGKGKKITATKTVNAVVGKDSKVTVSLPKALRGKTVSPNILDHGCFVLGSQPAIKGTKVTYSVSPREAGAAYVVWTVTDDDGTRSQAVTKVIVRKPIYNITISQNNMAFLEVGQGARLPVIATKGNTDPKDLSFKASGKGIKVSRSGYIVATVPGVRGLITVKAGNYSTGFYIVVKEHDGEYLTISKPSVNISIPKPTAKKNKTVALKCSTSNKSKPIVKWELVGLPKDEKRISINPDTGVVTVKNNAPAGCYVVKASAEGYNDAYCEIIVK